MVGKREETSGRGRIAYVPTHRLIYLSRTRQGDLGSEEAREALRLEFEENAPLPVEQLATGLLEDRERGRLAVVGCEREALPATGDDVFVLPGFLPFLGEPRNAGQWVCAREEEGSSLLFYEEAGWLPTEVIGVRSQPGEPEFAGEWARACAMVGWAGPADPGSPPLACVGAEVDSRDRARFTVHGGEGEVEATWELAGDAVWNADLRPPEELARLREGHRTDERLWTWVRGAAAVLVLAVVVQFLVWALDLSLQQKREEVSAQEEQVAAVEQRAGLVQRLRDLGGNRPSLFRSLGEINLLRPEEIQFLEVEFSQPGEFLIEGRTSAIRPLNDFAERITAEEKWELVERPRSRSREGRIEFELRLRLANPDGGSA